MRRASDIINTIEEGKNDLEFLPTGFASIDEFLDGGFMRKELVILGGQTGIGKSYFAGQVMFTLAKQGFKTAYFSLEISSEMVVSRLIGSLANIKPTRIMAGLLTEGEHEARVKAKTEVVAHEEYMDFYDDIYDFEQLKKLIHGNSYDFIVVDFLQNVEVSSLPEEYQRLTTVTRQLQKMAKEKDNCILALSQLSNVAANSGASSKTLEYKGSGAIAHACDLGFLIERGDINTGENLVKITLKKNRRGVSGYDFVLEFKYPGGWMTQAVLPPKV
jgi:replicative DNA helicase